MVSGYRFAVGTSAVLHLFGHDFRLQELSLGYTLPRKWFRNKMVLTVSFVGRNLWMIYCKAPFDPEAVASTGLSYQASTTS